jgi:biopolymer transport protein TolR
MAMKGFSAGTNGRRRHAMMAEINVTPMVDVMLVLLIIFMVSSAPLLTVGVPIDLPQTKAKSLDQDKSRWRSLLAKKGGLPAEFEIKMDELVPKLEAIHAGAQGLRRIYAR